MTRLIGIIPLIVLVCSCTTSTNIDEYRGKDTSIVLDSSEKVVVLGRRQAGEYETEPDFISCIGNKLANGGIVSVYPEEEFIDQLYPWFEPRTAPLHLKRMQRMLQEPMIAERVKDIGVRYMIWVDGNTEVTESDGSLSCAVGPGGGGCFGFATWDKASDYEAIIWDLQDVDEEGRVRVDARGSSYLIAVVAPVPFIARVQSEACDGIGKQLRTFFTKAAVVED